MRTKKRGVTGNGMKTISQPQPSKFSEFLSFLQVEGCVGLMTTNLLEARGRIFYVDHARAGSCHSYTDPLFPFCPTTSVPFMFFLYTLVIMLLVLFAEEEEYECLIFMNDSNIFITPIDPTEANQDNYSPPLMRCTEYPHLTALEETISIPRTEYPWHLRRENFLFLPIHLITSFPSLLRLFKFPGERRCISSFDILTSP